MTRGTVRRRSVEHRCERPGQQWWRDVKVRRDGGLPDSQLEGRALNGDRTTQPQDTALARFDLGSIVIVGFDASMRHGMGMPGTCSVDVLRRDGGGGCHPGTESEDQGQRPDGTHDQRIIRPTAGQ